MKQAFSVVIFALVAASVFVWGICQPSAVYAALGALASVLATRMIERYLEQGHVSNW